MNEAPQVHSVKHRDRVATIGEIWQILQDHGHGELSAKILSYEVEDGHMTINEARGIIGLSAVNDPIFIGEQ